ncbi:type II secretion system minor pseudopilin GspJ [Sphingomonas sp.]|uniref:type II secretion system minor pseudopilin GspJ n=1 Tax=Sphingomonas sp. TaxID=28214 RepID=UPI003AFF988D
MTRRDGSLVEAGARRRRASRSRRSAPACAGAPSRATTPQEGGFTLVEVMVALLIFAILASAGVALLSFSVRAQAAANRKLDDLGALQRTFGILSVDLAQASDRPVRDAGGASLPAFVGEAGSGAQPMLRLARGGWTNLDAQPRAGVQRVAYQLSGGVLQRIAWPRLDGAAPLPAAPLLDRVAAMTLRYRYRGAWSDRWDGATGVPLPQAVELRLTRVDGIAYRQMFLVGTGYAPPPPGPTPTPTPTPGAP